MGDYLLNVVGELWPHYKWTIIAGSKIYFVLFSGDSDFRFLLLSAL
jgi:hypothetical protein